MSKRKKGATAMLRRQRNLIMLNPLLGKSTIHGRSRKADRRRDKVALRKECDHQSAHTCTLVVTFLPAALTCAA